MVNGGEPRLYRWAGLWHGADMTELAQKLDERFRKLDAETLGRLEEAFLSLLSVVEQEGLRAQGAVAARPYRLKTYSLGVRPGIDPDKLSQLPEDF